MNFITEYNVWYTVSCVRLPDNGITKNNPTNLTPKTHDILKYLSEKFCQYVCLCLCCFVLDVRLVSRLFRDQHL